MRDSSRFFEIAKSQKAEEKVAKDPEARDQYAVKTGEKKKISSFKKVLLGGEIPFSAVRPWVCRAKIQKDESRKPKTKNL